MKDALWMPIAGADDPYHLYDQPFMIPYVQRHIERVRLCIDVGAYAIRPYQTAVPIPDAPLPIPTTLA